MLLPFARDFLLAFKILAAPATANSAWRWAAHWICSHCEWLIFLRVTRNRQRDLKSPLAVSNCVSPMNASSPGAAANSMYELDLHRCLQVTRLWYVRARK